MDVSKTLFDRFDVFVNKMKMKHAYWQTDKIFRKSLKNLPAEKKLTKQQKEEIQSFYYSMIGKKINYYSHEYFYSRTGIYSKEYIPRGLYHVELVPKANMIPYRDAYADKNMIDVLFPNVKRAHTILKRMNSYFYFDNKAVSKQEAIELCSNISNAIIKPILEHSGEGVQGLEVKNGITNINGLTIEKLFDLYGDNFLIQERLKQHAKMNELNATSVNTLRILTYRSGMEILLIYSVVRIGRQGQVVDNQSAGGMSTIIGEDGRLGKYAFSGFTSEGIEKTDSGTVLEGFEIPSYAKAIETVKQLHFQLPYFNLIGWDIAIDEEGDPVLIEWNASPGLSQSAFGPGLGKYTERIIRELWPRKNTRYNI